MRDREQRVALRRVREAIEDEAAEMHLRDYFAEDAGRSAFSGAWFERLDGGGDRPEVANRFTAEDLVAVTALSVDVPALAAVDLMLDRSGRFSELLRAIPTHLDPASGRELLADPSSAAHDLHSELQELPGIGWVIASKLMARKRPALVPVYDQVVRDGVGAPKSWWAVVADLWETDVPARLAQLREAAQVEATLLRVMDVILWQTFRPRTA